MTNAPERHIALSLPVALAAELIHPVRATLSPDADPDAEPDETAFDGAVFLYAPHSEPIDLAVLDRKIAGVAAPARVVLTCAGEEVDGLYPDLDGLAAATERLAKKWGEETPLDILVASVTPEPFEMSSSKLKEARIYPLGDQTFREHAFAAAAAALAQEAQETLQPHIGENIVKFAEELGLPSPALASA